MCTEIYYGKRCNYIDLRMNFSVHSVVICKIWVYILKTALTIIPQMRTPLLDICFWWFFKLILKRCRVRVVACRTGFFLKL
jgi:hypothetical protein